METKLRKQVLQGLRAAEKHFETRCEGLSQEFAEAAHLFEEGAIDEECLVIAVQMLKDFALELQDGPGFYFRSQSISKLCAELESRCEADCVD